MKHFQFPAIINDIFISTYLWLEAPSNRPRSSSSPASSALQAASIRILDLAVAKRPFYALRRTSGAITLPFDGIRLKSTGRRTYCRSAFGYDGKGAQGRRPAPDDHRLRFGSSIMARRSRSKTDELKRVSPHASRKRRGARPAAGRLKTSRCIRVGRRGAQRFSTICSRAQNIRIETLIYLHDCKGIE